MIYNRNMKFLSEFSSEGKVLDLIVLPDNTLMVLDALNEKIKYFTKTGKFIRSHGSYGTAFGQYRYLKGAVWNKRTKEWIVAESDNGRLQTKNRIIGSFGSGPENFHEPTQLAQDIYGNVYVADRKNNRIQVLSPNLTFLCRFGTEVLKEPYGVGVTVQGSVVVTDFYSVFVFSGGFD